MTKKILTGNAHNPTGAGCALRTLLVALFGGLPLLSFANNYTHMGQYGGKKMDDPTLYGITAFPSGDHSFEYYYPSSTPLALTNDFTAKSVTFTSYLRNDVNLSGHTLTLTATGVEQSSSGLSVVEDASVRLVSGHIVAGNCYIRPTKSNISAYGKPTFTVDGADASVQANVRLGVDHCNASLIVSKGLWTGRFYVGEQGTHCSNCLLRVTGPNSRYETTHNSRSILGYGGSRGRVEVLDGAVLCMPGSHSDATLDFGVESWSGYGGGDSNVLRVDNATLAVTNGSIRTYRSSSNRIEIVNGSTACINYVRLGHGNHYSNRSYARTRGNVFSVAGDKTRVTLQYSLLAGYENSQENVVDISDGARVYATNSTMQVIIGNVATAPYNTLRIRSGGLFRTYALVIGLSSDGNALELENGTCLVDAYVKGSSGTPALTMSHNDAALTENRLVLKGTNSYLYATYAILRGRLRYEIPGEGLAAAKENQAVFHTKHLQSTSAAVTVDVDGECPKGKWLLFSWDGSGDSSYSAAKFIASATLTGGGASRARLIAGDKKVYLKVREKGLAVFLR